MNTKNNIIHSHGKYCVPTNVLMYKRSYCDYSKNGRGKEVFLLLYSSSFYTFSLHSLSNLALLHSNATCSSANYHGISTTNRNSISIVANIDLNHSDKRTRTHIAQFKV